MSSRWTRSLLDSKVILPLTALRNTARRLQLTRASSALSTCWSSSTLRRGVSNGDRDDVADGARRHLPGLFRRSFVAVGRREGGHPLFGSARSDLSGCLSRVPGLPGSFPKDSALRTTG